MPVYTMSKEDLKELRTGDRCPQYSFLGLNATRDHGSFMTITLSRRSRDMLADQFGFKLDFFDDLNHTKEA